MCVAARYQQYRIKSLCPFWELDLPCQKFSKISSLQGSIDTHDALSLQVIFRKRALWLEVLSQKETYNLRHPMGLRHSVSDYTTLNHSANPQTSACNSQKSACRWIFRKGALWLVAHSQKETCNLRHPMSLRHSVSNVSLLLDFLCKISHAHHTHTHTYTHMHIHTHIHARTLLTIELRFESTRKLSPTHTHTHIHTHAHSYTHTYTYTHTHTTHYRADIWKYFEDAYTHTHMHTHTHTHTLLTIELTFENTSKMRKMAQTHKMPYLYGSFSAKEPYNQCLFCEKWHATCPQRRVRWHCAILRKKERERDIRTLCVVCVLQCVVCVCCSVSYVCCSVSYVCSSVSYVCCSVSYVCCSVSYVCCSVSYVCCSASYVCCSVSYVCCSVSYVCCSV